MEKIANGTPDITQENIDKIAELFPDCITEVLDENGTLKRAIDFDALKGDLSSEVAEGTRERYQFTWPGKAEAKFEARKPCTKTMRPCPGESVNWDTTENLYIEGDNLEALKIMRETYAGKIKLIYIDPPYNTGHDFIYDDDFAQTRAEYEEESGDFDEEGGRLVSNPESNGRFHSDWCSMLYPRLLLARDLLTNDGAIFISIDDNEVANLLKICDDAFGAENRVAIIPRQSRTSMQNDTDLSSNHEYLAVYAKKRRQENRRLKETNASAWMSEDSFACYPKPLDPERYSNPDNDPRGPWKADPFDAPNVRPNLTYPITNPDTGEQHLPPRGRHWRTMPEQYERLLADNRIVFGQDGRGRPQLKVFYEEKKAYGEVDNTWWDAERIPPNTNASKALMNLFDGEKVFDTPKPVELLTNIINLALAPSGDDLIMDFFAGSASAAEAVIRTNASDNGKRRFILVQMPEDCNESSAAYNAGYSNVSEIAKERIRRAGVKVAAEVEESNKQLQLGEEPKTVPDIGFRVLKIDSSNFRETYLEPEELEQGTLDLYVDNLKEDRTAEDLLFQVLPAFRIPYSAKIETFEAAGKTVYDVNEGQLLACFDESVDVDTIEEIAKRKPVYAVLRDASLKDDATEANFEELFKTYSPDTVRRVI